MSTETAIRMAVGLCGVAAIFGFLVGSGASPWFLLILPFLVFMFVRRNR